MADDHPTTNSDEDEYGTVDTGPGRQRPVGTNAEQAADDANEARQDSSDRNPANGQDAPVSQESRTGADPQPRGTLPGTTDAPARWAEERTN